MDLKNEFTEMIEHYKAIIYKVYYIYTEKEDDIHGYYQEVLINLWRSCPHFRGGSKRSSWIYRISLNTCISFVRKKKYKPNVIPITFDMVLFEGDMEKANR